MGRLLWFDLTNTHQNTKKKIKNKKKIKMEHIIKAKECATNNKTHK